MRKMSLNLLSANPFGLYKYRFWNIIALQTSKRWSLGMMGTCPRTTPAIMGQLVNLCDVRALYCLWCGDALG